MIYVVDITHRLSASEVTAVADAVVVVDGVGFEQQRLGNVAVPHMWVLAIFPCKRYRIEDVANAGVVRSPNEFLTFVAIGHFALEHGVEVSNAFGSGGNVFVGVFDLV